MDVWRKNLGIDVLDAAKGRISWAFETFPKVYLSGPSGKDSSAMMHLVCQEARARGRRVGVLYVDLEAQYQATISHVREMFDMYADVVDPYWIALPLRLRNAVSMADPYWICWDPEKRAAWVRQPDLMSITNSDALPFHWMPESGTAQEFEEFIEEFGQWYSAGEATCCFVGVRARESLNRWRAIVRARVSRFEGKPWTTWKGAGLVNAYPIYDWKASDIWTYVGRENLPYNTIYDQMYRAGLTLHQMRICQPYGDDQRRGLNLFHVMEPDTWPRIVARVSGANSGALYAGKRGNILGNGKVTLPDGHTWKSFAQLLLNSLPAGESEHYRDKIAVFLRWYQARGFPAGIPDEADPKDEAARRAPSWRRVCKCILRNDRMCRSLGFSQHKAGAYSNYRKLMQRRRAEWSLEV